MDIQQIINSDLFKNNDEFKQAFYCDLFMDYLRSDSKSSVELKPFFDEYIGYSNTIKNSILNKVIEKGLVDRGDMEIYNNPTRVITHVEITQSGLDFKGFMSEFESKPVVV